MTQTTSFRPQSAGFVMVHKIPTAHKTQTASHILSLLAKNGWDDIETVFVLSDSKKLEGIVPVHKLLIANKTQHIGEIMERVKLKVSPHMDQERLVIDAIDADVTSVPVVDHDDHLLGAVTSDKIIDILHEEHLEDLLRSSGIRGHGAKILDLINGHIVHTILARLPWLIVGLGIGFVASIIVSQFEHFLNANVEIAFFISMIAYISGAMSTQSETMFIRALTVTRFNIAHYLVRELVIGVVIGGVIGLVAAVGGYVLSQSVEIALAVYLSLLISVTVASVLACLVPLGLKALGRDPAIGSGPFATALQDLLSISIYFSIAYLILGIS